MQCQFRRMADSQSPAHFGPKKAQGMLQSDPGSFFGLVRSHEANENFGGTKIARCLDSRYSYKTDPGIFQFRQDNFTQFLLDKFLNFFNALLSHDRSLSSHSTGISAGNLFHDERFHDIAFLDVPVFFQCNAAFITGCDFFDIVFKPPQRLKFAFVNDNAVAEQADL